MVVLIMKKAFAIFLIMAAILVSTSIGAQRARFVTVTATREGRKYEEMPITVSGHDGIEEGEEDGVHGRMLSDYGNYEPAPTLSKPRYKLIPN